MLGGIANILHRNTLAMIVGGKTFDRGEQCFMSGRVLGVESARGELCGVVKPVEAGRAPYEVRLWVREDGLAYECTCPIGESRQFCKHAVAIALAHLDKERTRAERELEMVRARLVSLGPAKLVERLFAEAAQEPRLLELLREIAAR